MQFKINIELALSEYVPSKKYIACFLYLYQDPTSYQDSLQFE